MLAFFNTYTVAYANKVVLNVTNDKMSDIQKAKALHDWLCNAVDYDHDNKKIRKIMLIIRLFYIVQLFVKVMQKRISI